MKIVQVQTQAEAAGAQRVSDMVGAGLRQSGHCVTTVFMYRKTAAYDGVPHVDFILARPPRHFFDKLRAACGLFAYLRRQAPDVVITYQHFGNLFGAIGARLAGAACVVANQSGAPLSGGSRGIATRLDRWLGSLGLYDHNVVNSSWTEAQFIRYPRRYRERLRRIEHGVPGPAQRVGKPAARAAFDLPAAAGLVVSTGRLNPSKNHAVLVRALALLPDVHLAIAGAGGEIATLEGLATELGVYDRLHLVGEVAPARIFDFLAAGDVFAFPSRIETFGLAVVEAAIAGLPIVASDLPVLREVLAVPGGEAAAVFVPSDDPAAFAAALGRLLGGDEQAARLTSNSRALAARYAPDRMCEAYEALLDRA